MAMKARLPGGPRHRITSLQVLAKAGFRQPLLPTPTASYDKRGSQMRGQNAQGGPHLEEVLVLLPTPQANDGLRYRVRWQSEGRSRGLEQTMVDLSNGESTRGRSRPGSYSLAEVRLSPWFVEWMMGAPDGWSDPDCPLSATEFSSRPHGSAAGESSSTKGDAQHEAA